MSISHRKFRALVMSYGDAGTSGAMDAAYTVRSSGDADTAWWCSRIEPTGRETTTGMQADHLAEAVFGFAAECPVATDDAILCDGKSYIVTAVLDRDYGTDEVSVSALRMPATLTLSGGVYRMVAT